MEAVRELKPFSVTRNRVRISVLTIFMLIALA